MKGDEAPFPKPSGGRHLPRIFRQAVMLLGVTGFRPALPVPSKRGERSGLGGGAVGFEGGEEAPMAQRDRMAIPLRPFAGIGIPRGRRWLRRYPILRRRRLLPVNFESRYTSGPERRSRPGETDFCKLHLKGLFHLVASTEHKPLRRRSLPGLGEKLLRCE